MKRNLFGSAQGSPSIAQLRMCTRLSLPGRIGNGDLQIKIVEGRSPRLEHEHLVGDLKPRLRECI